MTAGQNETAAGMSPRDGQENQAPQGYTQITEAVKAVDAALSRRHLSTCETCGWPMVTPAGSCRKCAGPLCAGCREAGSGYCAPCLYAVREEVLR